VNTIKKRKGNKFNLVKAPGVPEVVENRNAFKKIDFFIKRNLLRTESSEFREYRSQIQQSTEFCKERIQKPGKGL
jgi:hypothetical protein